MSYTCRAKGLQSKVYGATEKQGRKQDYRIRGICQEIGTINYFACVKALILALASPVKASQVRWQGHTDSLEELSSVTLQWVTMHLMKGTAVHESSCHNKIIRLLNCYQCKSLFALS